MGEMADFLLAELRTARTARGQSQEDFGKLINYSGSHVSSVECGNRAPTNDFVAAIDGALATGGVYERLLDKVNSLDAAPSWLREWIEFEDQALILRWYEPAFVPGLLQTEAYARATLRAGGLLNAEQVDQRVRSRLDRQAILYRDDPPQLVVLIDEAVLRRKIDEDCSTMSEQLEHLAKCAELPHVHVQVIPEAVGLHPGLQGMFVLAGVPDGSTVAYLDNQVRAQIVAHAEDIATLSKTWEIIHREALPWRQSLDLIKEAAKK